METQIYNWNLHDFDSILRLNQSEQSRAKLGVLSHIHRNFVETNSSPNSAILNSTERERKDWPIILFATEQDICKYENIKSVACRQSLK